MGSREEAVWANPMDEGISQKKIRETKTKDGSGIYFAAEQISIQNNFSDVSDPKRAEAYKTYTLKATPVPPPNFNT